MVLKLASIMSVLPLQQIRSACYYHLSIFINNTLMIFSMPIYFLSH